MLSLKTFSQSALPRHEIRLGSHIWAGDVDVPQVGLSLSWMSHLAGQRMAGAKLAYETDTYFLEKTDLRQYRVRFDIVQRWRTGSQKRQCYADLGLSTVMLTDRIQRGSYFIYCPVGMSEELIRYTQKLYVQGTSGTQWYGGIATAVGLDWRIAKGWMMGIGSTGHYYYTAPRPYRILVHPQLSFSRQL